MAMLSESTYCLASDSEEHRIHAYELHSRTWSVQTVALYNLTRHRNGSKHWSNSLEHGPTTPESLLPLSPDGNGRENTQGGKLSLSCRTILADPLQTGLSVGFPLEF